MGEASTRQANDDDIESMQRELNRQRRVLDQTLSMQASLRDLDRILGTLLVCIILLTSLLGVAFAFTGGDEIVTLVGIEAHRTTWLGWLAVTSFATALVELVVDLRGSARRRGEAAKALTRLKGDYRSELAAGPTEASFVELSQKYYDAMDSMPEVPNWFFNRLKASHLRKIEISKMLSEHPGITYRRARKLLRERVR